MYHILYYIMRSGGKQATSNRIYAYFSRVKGITLLQSSEYWT